MRGCVNKEEFTSAEGLQSLLLQFKNPNRVKMNLDEFTPVYLNGRLLYTEDMFVKELMDFQNFSKLKLVGLDLPDIIEVPDFINEPPNAEIGVNLASFMRFDLMIQCLKSLLTVKPGLNFNLTIMVQEPQRYVRDFLKGLQKMGPFMFIIHDKNIDGAVRKKDLADACPNEYFVLLDDDMGILSPNWLLELKSGFGFDTRIAVSHAMLFHTEKHAYTHGGGYIIDVPPNMKFKFMNSYYDHVDGLPKIMPIQWVSSAGGMIKTEVFNEVPYDPAYCGYGDFDWSMALTRAGYGMVAARDAVILHKNEKRNTEYQTVVKESYAVRSRAEASKAHFFDKWGTGWLL